MREIERFQKNATSFEEIVALSYADGPVNYVNFIPPEPQADRSTEDTR